MTGNMGANNPGRTHPFLALRIGSWYYHFAEFGEMLEPFRRGLPVADLITHRFPFTDAAAAFRKFAAGETGKVLMLYGE